MAEKEKSFQAETLQELKKIMWEFIETLPAESFIGSGSDTIVDENKNIIGWTGKVLYENGID